MSDALNSRRDVAVGCPASDVGCRGQDPAERGRDADQGRPLLARDGKTAVKVGPFRRY